MWYHMSNANILLNFLILNYEYLPIVLSIHKNRQISMQACRFYGLFTIIWQ